MSNNANEPVRETPQDKLRMDDLLEHMLPKGYSTVLDVGTRFGNLSKRLTAHFDQVTALDLKLPNIVHERVINAQGNITHLKYSDNSFDVIYCTEVLEHIPPNLLPQACSELSRVARHWLIVGVPYNQDIRIGRTTCMDCGQKNPPWGHVNSFDENNLAKLFPSLHLQKTSYVGVSKEITNFISVWLMDLAGNPYGTYSQDETCIACSEKLKLPPERGFMQKVFTKLAVTLIKIQLVFVKPSPTWIHVMFNKNEK